MASRNWGSLSPAYRGRLERSGVTREQYETGASLAAARGHAATPEHPERAHANPARYQGYLQQRSNLVNDIQRAKRELFESTGKFNNGSSKRFITVDAPTGRVRTVQQLREILRIAKGLKDGTISWEQFKGSPEWDEYRHAFFYH